MVVLLISSILACVPPGEGAFETARVAPANVQVMLRVKDAAQLRADASMAPAHAALARFAGDRVLSMAWGRISEQLAIDGGAFFDSLLGTDATYMERVRETAVEWTVVTKVGQPTYDMLVERLKPSMQGAGRVVFSAQGMSAAWRPPLLIVGPSAHPALLEEVVASVDAPPAADGAPSATTLRHDAEVELASAWPAARMELILRTQGEHVGTTVATITPANGTLEVKHRSRFAKPPIHVAPGEPADSGLLVPFVEDSMAVIAMNPWRGALDPAEPVDALLLEGSLDDAMRANMGARQLLIVGERGVPELSIRAPSLGIAFEVRDPVLAQAQWDGWARRLVEKLAARAQQPAPEIPAVPDGKLRQVAVAPYLKEILADHPLVRGMEVCWMTISTPNGAWQLLATDRELIDRISSRIGGAVRTPAEGQWNEVGSIRTGAVAEHLRTWIAQARAFQPESPEAFTLGVTLAAELAATAQMVDWRAKAPEEKVIESQLTVKLRDPVPVQVEPTPQPSQPPPSPSPPPPPAPPPPSPPPVPTAP
jgi:hypothetical protein